MLLRTASLWLAVAVGRAAASLGLKNIVMSHGKLVPLMDNSVYKYAVRLDRPIYAIGMVPEIAPINASEPLPKVTMSWADFSEEAPSPFAVKRQIELPDDGSDLKVYIKVSSDDQTSSVTYRVTIQQAGIPPTSLRVLEGFDDKGKSLLIKPSVNPDDVTYNIYPDPEVDSFSLSLSCGSRDTMLVNGRKFSGEPFKRDKTRHMQVIEVTCRGSSAAGDKKYALKVVSDWREDHIRNPKLVLDERGQECEFRDDKTYRCPDVSKTHSKLVRIIASGIDPTIKYILASEDRSVELRVLNRHPTIPFSYNSKNFVLTGYAGQQSISWPVKFAGTALPSILNIVGYILASILAVLLITLAAVIGISNILGLGVPFGATEIAATLTLIIQYLCFANFLRGSSGISDIVSPLKGVTLFWPVPWTTAISASEFPGRKLTASHLWGNSQLGNVTDIRNACGCLFWTATLFAAFFILHAVIYLRFAVNQKQFTLPHRIRFGNWESRILHFLAFPLSVASTMLLSVSADLPNFWKIIAAASMAFYLAWVVISFYQVQSSIAENRVCWIWNSSVREDGSIEDESGYWMDVQADQLLTQPVNRSVFKGLFPYKWISTVADIAPISLSQALFNDTEVYPPHHFQRAHKPTVYPLAKNPQVVQVVKTRAPGGPCKGQRLIAGLLRTQWLDILFTYQGLNRFHSQINQESRNFAMNLIVKTSQLSGPIASGNNAFFFDGARIPFIRIADFIFRLALGVFIGVALGSKSHIVDAVMFSLVAISSGAFMSYVAATKPYSRALENWLITAMLATITFSACSLGYYAIRDVDPSSIADCFLWLVAICCSILAAYSCVVIFSVFSAFFCPPLEESRFLEKLANCSVTVSDDQAGWAFDVPAFSKYKVKDLRAHCTLTGSKRVHVTVYASGEEPSLEFGTAELKAACRSGFLAPPVCLAFVPAPESPLGYRHYSISSKDNVEKSIAKFLAADHTTKYLAEEVAKHISHHVEVRGCGKTILSVTIIPPKESDFSAVSTSSVSTEIISSRRRNRKEFCLVQNFSPKIQLKKVIFGTMEFISALEEDAAALLQEYLGENDVLTLNAVVEWLEHKQGGAFVPRASEKYSAKDVYLVPVFPDAREFLDSKSTTNHSPVKINPKLFSMYSTEENLQKPEIPADFGFEVDTTGVAGVVEKKKTAPQHQTQLSVREVNEIVRGLAGKSILGVTPDKYIKNPIHGYSDLCESKIDSFEDPITNCRRYNPIQCLATDYNVLEPSSTNDKKLKKLKNKLEKSNNLTDWYGMKKRELSIVDKREMAAIELVRIATSNHDSRTREFPLAHAESGFFQYGTVVAGGLTDAKVGEDKPQTATKKRKTLAKSLLMTPN